MVKILWRWLNKVFWTKVCSIPLKINKKCTWKCFWKWSTNGRLLIKWKNSKRSCGSKNENTLHIRLCYCSDRPAGDKVHRQKQLIITLPCASTGESFCSSNLATLKFPYFAARWSGVKPFFVVADRDAPCSSNTDATWMCENKILVFFYTMTLEERKGL